MRKKVLTAVIALVIAAAACLPLAPLRPVSARSADTELPADTGEADPAQSAADAENNRINGMAAPVEAPRSAGELPETIRESGALLEKTQAEEEAQAQEALLAEKRRAELVKKRDALAAAKENAADTHALSLTQIPDLSVARGALSAAATRSGNRAENSALPTHSEAEPPAGLTEYSFELSPAERDALQSAAASYTDNGRSFSFVLLDLYSGQLLSYRADAVYYSASLLKAPYIFSLLASGVQPDEHMEQALRASDNTAYEWLAGQYGYTAYGNYLQLAGSTVTDPENRYSDTTALDMAKLWTEGCPLLAGEDSQASWLRSQCGAGLHSALQSGLGSLETVYSKAGWIADGRADPRYNVYNDAGIVDDGVFPYVLVIMSDCYGTTGIAPAETLSQVLDRIHLRMMEQWLEKQL